MVAWFLLGEVASDFVKAGVIKRFELAFFSDVAGFSVGEDFQVLFEDLVFLGKGFGLEFSLRRCWFRQFLGEVELGNFTRRFNAESIWGEALIKLGRIEQAAPLIETSHTQLLERKSLLPNDLQLEFLVPSFDRMIELSEAKHDSKTVQDLKSQKSEFLNELGL